MFKTEFADIFSFLMAASKDKAYEESVERVQNAFHTLILADAEARRSKTATLISAMAKIDAELIRFKREYNRIENQLTPEAKQHIEKYIVEIVNKKKDIIQEKNSIKVRR